MFETPILFLIFNREDTTRKVFEAIRRQKPKYLYVAADGARKHKQGEAETCQRVRDIIQVDWDCELKMLYRDENLGCKIAVSSAITWFFEHVEQGIILEDDCLPDLSFFPYCEELLNKYKDDTRIGHIGGNNFLSNKIIDKTQSYDFSSYSYIWGWATWRRAWKNYDVDFKFWNEHKDKRSFLFCNKWEEIYFSSFISDVLHNQNGINTWDTQWMFTLRSQNQLSIYPAVNLVTNIGLGDPNAVHTSGQNKKLSIPTQVLPIPLKHPDYVLRNEKLDEANRKRIFFSWKRLARHFYSKILKTC
jgi:hypothetical protein